jgi:DNA-binding IclR family transcriptional regulator
MSSLARMLAVLTLFEKNVPTLDADTICARLGYSQPTGYRYIAELVRAGLIARIGVGAYGLGPRIIELDYSMREADPVLAASKPVMSELVAVTGGDATLASCYGDKFVTTHHQTGPDNLSLSYGRGRPMPLLRGALSKCLLAYLPRAQQQRIHKRAQQEETGGEDDWNTRRAGWTAIRKQGYAISIGELDPGVVAVAAPIFDAQGSILATVAVVLRKQRYDLINKTQLTELVMDAARRIGRAVVTPALLADKRT